MKTNYIFKTGIISKMIFVFLLAFIINSNAQSISSIQPNPVAPGQILSVLGTNLHTTTSISFNGSVSSTATGMFGGTSVTVPAGAMTGLITLMGPGMFLESITVLTVSSSIGNQASFAPSMDFSAIGHPKSISINDFNGDGYKDLAVLNNTAIGVLTNTGSGGYGLVSNYDIGTYLVDISSADFNKDGKYDLVIVNNGDNVITVLTAAGNGTFGSPINYFAGTSPQSVAIADFNGDGNSDLAVVNFDSNVSILLGTGLGSFSSAVNYPVGTGPQKIAASDFNNDGKQDLVIQCNYGDGNNNFFTINILTGDGIGGFTTTASYQIETVVNTEDNLIIISDINNDGRNDIIAGSSPVYLLTSTGIGSFDSPKTIIGINSNIGMVTSDFDNDGLIDIAYTTIVEGKVYILKGNGSGAFSPSTNFSTKDQLPYLFTSDINTDGKADLITVNYWSGDVSIFLNQTGSPIAVSNVIISSISGTVIIGTQQLFTANVFPSNAIDKSVTWSIFPTNMGSIIGGNFYAGTTTGPVTITATSVSNPSVAGIAVVAVTPYVDLSSINISPPFITISGGSNTLFTANVLPSNAADKSVTWSISPSFVGYIASDGTYTTPTTFTGVVTITATSVSNPSITGIAIATIIPYVDVASVGVTPSILTVSGGGSQLFTANILPANATDKSVIWSIFPSNAGAIALDGTFTAGAYTGAVTITATSMPNSIVGIAKVFIDGVPFVGVTSFFISPSSSVLIQGNSQLMMVENLLPLNATDKTIYWSFEPGNMGSILNDGTFHASITSTGIVTITAASVSDPSVIAYATITVISPIVVTSISIIDTTSHFAEGESFNYTVSVLPANATNKNVTWTSSNTIVGIIDSNGLFTGLSAGTTTITAISISNPAVMDRVMVTFNPISTTSGNDCINPVHAGSITRGLAGGNPMFGLGNPSSVFVSGNYAYVTSIFNNALEIIDISNPTSPVNKASISTNQGPLSVFVEGNYAYVTSNNGGTGSTIINGSLEIIDISSPIAPTHKGSIAHGTASLNHPISIYVSGNYAYITSYFDNALEIIDISNPSAPIHKGALYDASSDALLKNPYDVHVSGNYAYVASRGSDALEIIDVSIPAIPVHKGKLPNSTGGALLKAPLSVYVSGTYAYLTSNNQNDDPNSYGALEIVDITNPANPIHKGSLTNEATGGLLSVPVSISVLGDYAYIASNISNALEIVDVSNPENPIHKSSIIKGTDMALLDSPQSVYVSEDFAYVVSSSSNSLDIISLSCNTTISSALIRTNYFISIVNSGAQTVVVNGNTIVSWPTIAGASTYCLQYSTDSTFATNVVTVCGLTTPSYTISGFGNASGRTEGQTIYWKVGAVDDATGAIYWSDVQNTARVLQVAAPISVDQLQLYPNPSSDLINISGLKTNDEVLIYDVHGSLVLKTKASSINISSLSNGLYVARINTKSLRFVKQ